MSRTYCKRKYNQKQPQTEHKMADNDRIVYPDEVEQVKADAKKSVSTEAGDSNSIEQPPQVTMRNMISVPDNCPPGYKIGPDGVCREVFD